MRAILEQIHRPLAGSGADLDRFRRGPTAGGQVIQHRCTHIEGGRPTGQSVGRPLLHEVRHTSWSLV